MNKFCLNNNYQNIQILQHEPTSKYFVLYSITEENYLILDICSDYLVNGHLLLSETQLLNNPIKKDFYNITSQQMELAYLLIKKVLKNNWSINQINYINDLIVKIESSGKLELPFNTVLSQIVCELKKGEIVELEESVPLWKKKLLIKSFFSFRTICYLLLDIPRRFKRIANPTGLFIVFIGPDGSGKSSVINGIKSDIFPAFRKYQYYHLKPIESENSSIVDNPHSDKMYSVFLSIIKLIYLLFIYNSGYLINVKPKLIKSTLIVFDRYFHDIIVDPKRYRYGAPTWIVKLIGKLIPKPDLFILLDAPEEVLQTRKQEVPYEESKRQRKEYLKLIKSLKDGYTVDASQDLDSVVRDTDELILEFLEKRYEKRYNIK